MWKDSSWVRVKFHIEHSRRETYESLVNPVETTKRIDLWKGFLAGNFLLPLGISLHSLGSQCSPPTSFIKFHRMSPTGEAHGTKRRKRWKEGEKKEKSEFKKKKKTHSAPFSHEIESLSGMWGHVCLDRSQLHSCWCSNKLLFSTEFDFFLLLQRAIVCCFLN